MKQPSIIVSGKNGQVGNELNDLSVFFPQYRVVFLGHTELDITKRSSLENVFKEHNPAWFINVAAYTAVDKAETDQQQAYLVNAEAPGIIGSLCKNYQTKLIHISTDYVFSGTASIPYKEDDATNPVNYYGYSKWMGEQLALKNNPETIVIRTSWVYSKYGNNFVKTMLRLMKDRPEINVVNDQLGSPTWANDLAGAVFQIVEKCGKEPENFKAGIYHFCNGGIISWYDFATAIRDIKKINCKVNPISTSQYPTPAKRPVWSVMSAEKIKSVFGLVIPQWQDSLAKCLEQL